MAKAKKLPSGNWRVQASKTVNGQKLRKSFTFSDRRKAELDAARWVNGIERENDKNLITLKQAVDRYISVKENVLSPATVRGYASISRMALQDIMQTPICSLTLDQLQMSVNIYAASHSPKSVRNCVGLLSAVFAMFRPDFRLSVTVPQKGKRELFIPDDNDIKKLLELARETPLEIPIMLAAFGPMRRGEICALTSDDIHGNIVSVNKSMVVNDNGEWLIKPPKTYSSYREIEYPDFVIEKLSGISGRIVPVVPNALSDAFSRLLKKNGFPHFRFHDLRHYAVSTLHAINVPDKYIMARGGWQTNYTMNNIYNHTIKSKRDEMEDRITEHFNGLVK